MKLLRNYTSLLGDVQEKNITVLAYALVFDLNAPDFFDILLKNGVIKNQRHYGVEMSRLKRKGFFFLNEKKEKILSKPLMGIKELVSFDLKTTDIYFLVQYTAL